jgi:hypothetical protein
MGLRPVLAALVGANLWHLPSEGNTRSLIGNAFPVEFIPQNKSYAV